MTAPLQYKLPALWCGYLMYGDSFMLFEGDIEEIKAWQAAHTDARPRACEDVTFGLFNNMQQELLTYTWS